MKIKLVWGDEMKEWKKAAVEVPGAFAFALLFMLLLGVVYRPLNLVEMHKEGRRRAAVYARATQIAEAELQRTEHFEVARAGR